MRILPVYVNWPLLVAYLAHQNSRRRIAWHAGVSETAITSYLDGRITTARFEVGLNLLAQARSLTPFEIWNCTGYTEIPDLPDSVDWSSIKKMLKATYRYGEITSTMRKVERDCYDMAFKRHRESKPLWPNGAVLLNLAQDRLSAAEYQILTNLRTKK